MGDPCTLFGECWLLSAGPPVAVPQRLECVLEKFMPLNERKLILKEVFNRESNKQFD